MPFGQSTRREFAVACLEGRVRGGIGLSGGSMVSGWNIERGTLDCTGEDRRVDAAVPKGRAVNGLRTSSSR